jgi:hypothetical protein
MFQTVCSPIFLIKAGPYSLKERIVISFKFEKDCVGHVISQLQQARVVRTCRVRQVFGEIPDGSNLRSAPAERTYPRSSPLVKSSLGKYKEPSLLIACLMKAGQEEVEPSADFFDGELNGSLAVNRGRFFDGSRKQDTTTPICIGEDRSHRLDHLKPDFCRDISPEVFAFPHWRSMHRNGFVSRQEPVLHIVDGFRQEMNLALKHGNSGEHEMPVGGVTLISGFVEVKDVHKRKGNRLPCGIESQKGDKPVATQLYQAVQRSNEPASYETL